jgi:galactose oxidase-like protein
MRFTRGLFLTFEVLIAVLALKVDLVASPRQGQGQWVSPPFNHGIDPANPGWDPDQGSGSGSQGGKAGSNCKYNAIHLGLIPTGPNQGRVLAFGIEAQPYSTWSQFWSIINVGAEGTNVALTTTYGNYSMALPSHKEMFCSGLAWMADGRLFQAGGTYVQNGFPFVFGSDMCFIYDPNTNTWTAVSPSMARGRWYPTVTLSSDDTMMVFSGTADSDGNCVGDTSIDTYEAWDPSLASGAGAWQVNPTNGTTVFDGPGSVSTPDYFRYYPRMHVLTNGRIFMSGMHVVPARLRHDKTVTLGGGYSITSQWEVLTANPMVGRRLYGSSFLFPGLEDVVMSSVGADYEEACRISDPHSGPIVNSVQYAVATASPVPTTFWSDAESVPDETVGSTTYVGARTEANTVILPDESILLIGGENVNSSGTPVALRDTRRFTGQPDTGSWALMASEDSDRGYHATALLLPDGRVLSAGGNDRDFDYQVYRPPYLTSGNVRPALNSSPATMQYFDANPVQYSITYNALPPGVVLEKIVLVAPGADTHHSDMSQRLVRLTMTVTDLGGTRTKFYAPRDSKHAPRGYYMLFAVTNQGTPSIARWVKLS